MDARCRRCGENGWTTGLLRTALGGSVQFRPDHARFATLETGNVDVRARMCTVCGAVDLIGDVEKLERLLGESAPTERAEP